MLTALQWLIPHQPGVMPLSLLDPPASEASLNAFVQEMR